MKVSVPACAPATPPDTGASSMAKPLLLRGLRHRARGLDVDGRAIDQQRAARRARQHAVRAEIDRAHLLARRQHGDDDLGVLARLGDRGRRHAARRGERLDRGLVHVEARAPRARP